MNKWVKQSEDVKYPSRVGLTNGQVKELLAQLEVFGAMIVGDLGQDNLDKAEWASLYALQISKILA